MTLIDTTTTTAAGNAAVALSAVPSPAPLGLVRRRPGQRRFAAGPPVPVPGTARALAAGAAALVHRYTGEQTVLLGTRGGQAVQLVVDGAMSWADLLVQVDAAAADPGRLAPVVDLIARRRAHDPAAPACHVTFADPAGAGADTADIVLHRGELVLNVTLWAPEDTERIARHLAALSRAAEQGTGRIGDTDLLGPGERHTLLHGWNDTARPCPPQYVHEIVEEVAARDPQRPAVDEPGGTLNYRDLADRVAAVRTLLAGRGCRPGRGVALLMERSADNLAAQLAAFGLGAPVVLIDPEYPEARIRYMLEDSGAVAVVARPGQVLLAGCPVPIVEIEAGAAVQADARPPACVSPDPDDVCHVVYTSGSTGAPKAVELRYGPMRQLTHTLVRECGIEGGARGTWLSSPGLGMVEVDALPVLAGGGTVVIGDPALTADPERLRDWIVSTRATHALMITSMAERICSQPWPERTALRHLRIAGERCRTWPAPEVPFTVLNVYGSSEATVVSLADLTAVPAAARVGREPPVGRPVDNVRLYVLDDSDRPVPPGVTGHLHISGESLSRGYLRRPGVDTSAFRENPIDGDPYPVLYRSGDLARFWPDGTLEVVGRTDDQVKVRGHRVTLGEVEAVLLAHQDVRQAAVLASRSRSGDTVLTAYVEPAGTAEPSHSGLRRHVADRLPGPSVPARFVVGALPQSSNGKIERGLLVPADGTRPTLDTPYRPAETDAEQALLPIWEDTLEVTGLGVDDDFFELGGDSLRAMRLLARMAENLGLALTTEDLQAAPTVRGSAARARERDTTTDPALPTALADPAHAHDPFPLTESQQSLWIGRGSAVDLGDVGCHGYFEWDNDALDPDRFQAAWSRLVERHDMLRAVICTDGTQRVLPDVPAADVPVDDLRGLEPAAAAAAVDEVRGRMSHQVLDTTSWPLYEVRISLLPDGHSRVHLSLDMLIVDAWSLYQALIPDLVELYEDPDRDLPDLEIGFRDYVLARELLRDLPQYDRARRYWLDRLPELPAAPALPMATRRDDELRFQRCELDIEPQRWATLQAAARERRVTPSGLVVSAFAEVLRAWSSDDAFTINFPVSDRLPIHPQVDRMVGDFTNTLLVAVEKSDGTFADRARSIQQQIWRDLEHRHFTGVEVLREIARREGGPLRPAMPIVLTSLLGHPGHRSSGDLGREAYGVSQTPQVLLDVQLREIDGTLHIKWDHLPAAFPPGLVEAMFEAFRGLMDRLADDSRTWECERFDLLPPGQRVVRDRVNATDAPVPGVTLPELFAEQVRQRRDEPAVVTGDRTVRWGELGAAAHAVAGRLRAACAPGRDRLVAVAMPKGWEQYAAVHGTQATGAAYLPLDVTQPDARLSRMLDRAGVVAVLATPEEAPRFAALSGAPVVTVCAADLEGAVTVPETSTVDPDAIAYVIYTSGSTGEPKGVAVAHRAVVNHVLDATERFGLTADDRQMGTAGLHFDMSVFDVFGPVAHGGAVVLPPPAPGPDPDRWLQLAAEHGVTFWAAVPALMEMVCELHEHRPAAGCPALRRVVLAGDWIPIALPERIRAMAPDARVASCGGPTETTNWSISYEITEVDPAWASIPYGMPMANSRYHIVGPQLRDRPDWVAGEMLVESPIGLARGYWNDVERTTERFVTDPDTGARYYRTGDLGRYLPDGNIEILGRDDFQVKIHGHRIELGEIDHALGTCPGVQAATVVSTARAAGPPRLVGFAVAPGVEADAIAAHLRERLPGYMVPRDLRLLDTLPLTANGKIDRQRLVEVAGRPPSAGVQRVPADALTEVVTACCAVVLDLAGEVGPEANFFAAGGDSLTAMRLSTLLSDALGVEVSLGTVLQAARLVDVAESVAADPVAGELARAAADRLRSLERAGA